MPPAIRWPGSTRNFNNRPMACCPVRWALGHRNVGGGTSETAVGGATGKKMFPHQSAPAVCRSRSRPVGNGTGGTQRRTDISQVSTACANRPGLRTLNQLLDIIGYNFESGVQGLHRTPPTHLFCNTCRLHICDIAISVLPVRAISMLTRSGCRLHLLPKFDSSF